MTFRFLDQPRRYHPALIGALLALSFATKESTFITVFVAGTFFLAVADLAPPARSCSIRCAGVGLDAWGWALAAFIAVYTIAFTTFLTHPKGVQGLYTGLDYWLGQHSVGRGGESDVFYGVVLAGVEWPALLLGAIGAVAAIRRPTLLRVFLIWAFLLSLLVYSWAGEKFAWLVLHPLLPLILLAGVGVQAIWETRRGTGTGSWASPPRSVAFAYVGVRLVRRSTRRPPRRPARAARLDAVGLRGRWPTRSRAQVVAKAKASAAHGHRRRGRGRDVPLRVVLPRPPASATSTSARQGRAARLGRADPHASRATGCSRSSAPTRSREFPFRVWWVRDYGKITPGSWWRWLTKREPWDPTGGMPEWLYREGQSRRRTLRVAAATSPQCGTSRRRCARPHL